MRSPTNDSSIKQKYQNLNLSPVPLHRGTKIPAVKWKSWEPTPERIDEFSKYGVNWALRTGKDYGIIVLDLDLDKPGAEESLLELPFLKDIETVTTLTPSGGEHRWFKPNSQFIPSGEILPGIEILGEDHLATVPPSKDYQFEIGHSPDEVEIAPLPQELEDLAFGRKPKKTQGKQESGPKFNGTQKEALERTLDEYLPGAKKQGGEIAGYTDPNSQSKAHINVNLDKGVFIDWHNQEGGTIIQLLKLLGAPIPQDLEEMGKPGIPEYLPIWAIDKAWFKKWKCGEPIVVTRMDGVPIYSGRAFCMTWGCPECSLRLTNIQKAKVKQEPIKALIKATDNKEEVGKKLAKVKRTHKGFEYKRLKGEDSEWILVKDTGDVEIIIYTLQEEFRNNIIWDPTEDEIDQVVEDLPNAKVERKERRVIGSRNYHSKAENSIYNNFNMKETSGTVEEDELTKAIKDNEGPKLDMVLLKGNYEELLQKLGEVGFEAQDTSKTGETHMLIGSTPITEKVFEQWGLDVKGVIELPRRPQGP